MTIQHKLRNAYIYLELYYKHYSSYRESMSASYM